MKKRPETIAPSAARKWWHRLSAMVLIPLLLLGVTEGVLRLCGYGYDTSFFSRFRFDHQDFLVNNEKFSLRFFPPQLTRWPTRIMMKAEKPADTCRIFIMGESAAMGDPEVAYGPGRFLQTLLEERFPARHFEIVNVAITAINSNVILPIARECAGQHGDLWIIYMGNNEMVGPFGAATIFGSQAPPLGFIRLNLAVQRTRLGQLLLALTSKFRRVSTPASWSGMEMFLGNQIRPDDARKEVVYHNFERNLRDIVRAGLGSGAKVLLNTVAVNLKDCPPFASVPATATAFSAEAEYRQAQTWLSGSNVPAARAEFQKACDDDALPFRADSRINGLIEHVGQQLAGGGLSVFDTTAALASASPAGVCGRESFYEHVHFNFDGSYRLAKVWAEQVATLLAAKLGATAAGPWATQETCERRLGLSDWNREAAIAGVLQRLSQPPLSTQSDHAQRAQELQSQLQQIRSRMTADAVAPARAMFGEALRRAPDDHFLHENFAAFLAATGDFDGAIDQWRQIQKLLPLDFTPLSRMGGLLARQQKWVEAESSFRQALAMYPANSQAWLGLGETQAAEGETPQAMKDFAEAQRLEPRDPRPLYYIGGALSKLNRTEEATQEFREAVRLSPDYWEAHFALGVELGSHDHLAEARSEFEQVVRLNPAYADAHLNLAVALMQQNQWQDAQKELEETLRLDPGNAAARQYLRQIPRAP